MIEHLTTHKVSIKYCNFFNSNIVIFFSIILLNVGMMLKILRYIIKVSWRLAEQKIWAIVIH